MEPAVKDNNLWFTRDIFPEAKIFGDRQFELHLRRVIETVEPRVVSKNRVEHAE